VTVTGYGDILLSEYSQPPLTTVHRSIYQLGHPACQLIISQLRGEALASKNIVIEPSLVIRQSSDLALWL
jgi:DNA-binding LacI/PurR family transcriptional regulator